MSLRATAAALVLAMAAAPLLLDQCVGTCEAHRHAIASSPGCHHAGSTDGRGVRMASVPAPCGHDHGATAVTALGGSFRHERALQPVAAVITPTAPGLPFASRRLLRVTYPQGRAPAPAPSPLTLRI